jgi:hypothetical protein
VPDTPQTPPLAVRCGSSLHPPENHSIGVNNLRKSDFNDDKATYQWFNTLTGEFTEEKKWTFKDLVFWDGREEADAILIVRNLMTLNNIKEQADDFSPLWHLLFFF